MTRRPHQPPSPAASAERATPGCLVTVEEACDVLMRRSLEDHAPSAHLKVIEAARALEDFRLSHSSDDLERAEESACQAITTFPVRTGERDLTAWKAAVVYMVELRAARYSLGRISVFDPAPAPPSLYTPISPMRLENLSYDGHHHILTAARWLERARSDDETDIAKAPQAIHRAARLLHHELPSLSLPMWVLICRYCAETHAQTLRGRRTITPADTG